MGQISEEGWMQWFLLAGLSIIYPWIRKTLEYILTPSAQFAFQRVKEIWHNM